MKRIVIPVFLATILGAGAVLVAVVLYPRGHSKVAPAQPFLGATNQWPANSTRNTLGSLRPFETQGEPIPGNLDTALRQALAEQDPARCQALLSNWARSIPIGSMAEALESTKSIQDGPARAEVRTALFNRWASVEPRAATETLCQHAADAADDQNGNTGWIDLFSAVVPKWLQSHPTEAVTWIQSLADGPVKSAALAQMDCELSKEAGNWAEYDPHAAAAWAAGLPPGEGSETATAFLATVWAHKDPAAAASYAAGLPASGAQVQAAVAVASTWALTQPQQAAQWAGQLPEGAAREQSMQAVVEAWAKNDPDAAARWLQALPPAPSRDTAISTFSSTIGQSVPDAAFQWAETISSESIRNIRLQNVAVAWMARDPAAAQQAIAQSDLPQDIKNQLLPAPSR